ncbi:MAG: HAD family hydrolase [Porticoccaceae bacterium]
MPLAIFDLDNTLIAGDSDYSWGEFLVAQGKVDSDYYRVMNDRFFADYEAGRLDINAYLQFSLEPLSKITMAELSQLHEKFMAEVISPMMLDKAQGLLEKHRRAGDQLLVITSTNRFIVEPICKALGIDRVIATELEVVNGRYTGKVSGTPSYREGKVERLNNWLTANRQDIDGSYFYSDSINDLPLLQKVDYPVAVDPDPQLRAQAAARGWQIISLRD